MGRARNGRKSCSRKARKDGREKENGNRERKGMGREKGIKERRHRIGQVRG